MKRNLLNWTLAIAVLVILAFSGCRKDDGILTGGCTNALQSYLDAYEIYIDNPNAQSCQSLSDALHDYISSCTPGKFYENQLDELDCSDH